ncbi:hypothetical protein PQD74_gp008 [Stenotrophomonas phage Siara]|uniref:Uncharacterized protein n=1 Tax=Stenotrophomonas phage Siara TaxID=2859658 RepID=A0AAE7WM50_9CAUD|nr:hypothetical protein PQD74_gp008 [Stenotrophomonas phage Siara]QYW02011.1 hypothetical protein CPT_Siara_008 [Stenotrophomonas phage Siara]
MMSGPYYALEAAAPGMRGRDSRRVALVHYTGDLEPHKLKINPRFKGLTVVWCETHKSLGHDSKHMRRLKEAQQEAKALNAGMIHVEH